MGTTKNARDRLSKAQWKAARNPVILAQPPSDVPVPSNTKSRKSKSINQTVDLPALDLDAIPVQRGLKRTASYILVGEGPDALVPDTDNNVEIKPGKCAL